MKLPLNSAPSPGKVAASKTGRFGVFSFGVLFLAGLAPHFDVDCDDLHLLGAYECVSLPGCPSRRRLWFPIEVWSDCWPLLARGRAFVVMLTGPSALRVGLSPSGRAGPVHVSGLLPLGCPCCF